MSVFTNFRNWLRRFTDEPTPPIIDPVTAIPPQSSIITEPVPEELNMDAVRRRLDALAIYNRQVQDEARARQEAHDAQIASSVKVPSISTPNTGQLTGQEYVNHILGRDDLPVTVIEDRKPVDEWAGRIVDVDSLQGGGSGLIDPQTLGPDDWNYYVRHPEVWGKIQQGSGYAHQQINAYSQGGNMYDPAANGTDYRGILSK